MRQNYVSPKLSVVKLLRHIWFIVCYFPRLVSSIYLISIVKTQNGLTENAVVMLNRQMSTISIVIFGHIPLIYGWQN